MKFTRREFLAASGSLAVLPFLGQDSGKIEPIKVNGEADNRVNMVFIAEGFSRSSQDRFEKTVDALIKDVWADGVLKDYGSYFNFYKVRTESEKDWDGGGTGTVFGTRASRSNQALELDWASVIPKIPRDTPRKHILCLIVNNSEGIRSHGGGVEQQGHLATGSSASVFWHELGHALGLLADEYPDGGTISEKYSINTSESEKALPWQALVDARVSGIGVYKVAGLKRTFFRGEDRCVMLQNDNAYGPLCRWGMIMGILRHARILDEFGANERAIPAKFIPDLKVKLLVPESGKMNVKWGTRQVKPEEAFKVMKSVSARDYTLETFNEQKGWTIRPGDMNAREHTTSLPLEGLPKGTHVVTVFAQDLNPGIFADPWQVAVDSHSWVVDQA